MWTGGRSKKVKIVWRTCKTHVLSQRKKIPVFFMFYLSIRYKNCWKFSIYRPKWCYGIMHSTFFINFKNTFVVCWICMLLKFIKIGAWSFQTKLSGLFTQNCLTIFQNNWNAGLLFKYFLMENALMKHMLLSNEKNPIKLTYQYHVVLWRN